MNRAYLGDVARRQFLRLPPPTRARLLALTGRLPPWDPRFDHHSPPPADGLVGGPPGFVGIGVQKAGTTWWHSLIARHPGVYCHPGVHKERHFFSALAERDLTGADIAAYHGWFPRPAGRLSGEWTPDYLYQDWVPTRLHAAAPDAKLLVILRDPVERYRSGCAHQLTYTGRLTAADRVDAYHRGLYAADLERFEAVFGRAQMLVLQYERCRDDPAGELARTLAFLDLDDTWRPLDLASGVNRGDRRRAWRASPARDAELAEHYASDMARLASTHPGIDLGLWPSARSAGLAG